MKDALERQQTSKRGFIRAYGLFWQAEEVVWEQGELLGRLHKNLPALEVANFWEQKGIYILHSDYGAYYVGKTVSDSMSLGERLSQHHLGSKGSPHRGKWNRFSWFGWRRTLKSRDSHGLQKLGKLPHDLLTSSSSTIQDIESLLIHSLGTINAGNGRRETFVAAIEWRQIAHSDRDFYLNKIVHR